VTGLQALAAKLRNLFVTGELTRRDGARVQGTTRFGRVVDGREMHPYGFAARAKKGTVLFFFEGGDTCAPTILYVSSVEGIPDLEDGDSALWTEDGGCVVARNDGSIELNGKSMGGLTKTRELKTQLEKNSGILQALLSVLNSAPIPEPGSGSPSALQAALKAAVAGKAPGDFSQIESDKVFHGDSAH
jgi:phage gp45-like